MLCLSTPASEMFVSIVEKNGVLFKNTSWLNACLSQGFKRLASDSFDNSILSKPSDFSALFLLVSSQTSTGETVLQVTDAVTGVIIHYEEFDPHAANTLQDWMTDSLALLPLNSTNKPHSIGVAIKQGTPPTQETQTFLNNLKAALLKSNSINLIDRTHLESALYLQDYVMQRHRPPGMTSVYGQIQSAKYICSTTQKGDEEPMYVIISTISGNIISKGPIAANTAIPDIIQTLSQ